MRGGITINGYANLIYEQVSGMGIITINRPQALNALNRATLTELDKLLEQISGDPATSVVIITGSGEKAFVAGADITEMKDLPALPGREVARLGQAVFNKLENLPQPVIAAVNGFALGGGCELALACDIRIAADNAKFGQPEVSLGIPPGFGGTQRLPRLIGKGRAQELLLTGDIIDAQEAYRLGLVNKIVPAGELQAAAKAMAEKIMGRAQIAVELCKSAVNKGLDAPLSVGLAYEAEVFGLCFATDDQKEGMAAFTERREANFAGK